MAFLGPFSNWDRTTPTGSTQVRLSDEAIRANWRDLNSTLNGIMPEWPGTTRFIGPSAGNELNLGSSGATFSLNNLFLKGKASVASAHISTLRSNSSIITTIRANTKMTGPLVSAATVRFTKATGNLASASTVRFTKATGNLVSTQNARATTIRANTKMTGPLVSASTFRFTKATGNLVSTQNQRATTMRANTKMTGPLVSAVTMRFTKATGNLISTQNQRATTMRANTKMTGPLVSATNLRFTTATGNLASASTVRFTKATGGLVSSKSAYAYTSRANTAVATAFQYSEGNKIFVPRMAHGMGRTNANGGTTVTHGLGAVPVAIMLGIPGNAAIFNLGTGPNRYVAWEDSSDVADGFIARDNVDGTFKATGAYGSQRFRWNAWEVATADLKDTS